MIDVDYDFLSRLLHQVSLSNSGLKKLSFDIEKSFLSNKNKALPDNPVFVTGLARGGTTILMRAIYETNAFVSLTYKNMPFILAPNFWKKIKPATHVNPLKERSHGDGIMVNAESPEAFDEVFWKTFCQKDYIFKNKLIPHQPAKEVCDDFKKYIHLILLSNFDGTKKRYLSKNNNNVLRLNTISAFFPEAVILIPFRTPLQHAASLLNQQNRFVQLQTVNKFILKYMNWLGHFEFGLGQRPFIFSEADAVQLEKYPNTSINYWLQIWKNYYGYILNNLPKNAVLISYEKLCSGPERMMDQLSTVLKTNLELKKDFFSLKNNWTDYDCDGDLLTGCNKMYEILVEKSL